MRYFVVLLLVFGLNSFANELNVSPEGVHDINALKIACDDGNGKACMRVGTIYENAIKTDIPKDDAKAFKYYSKGCELNENISCTSVGTLYYIGKGVSKNKTKAKQFLQKGCDLENDTKCFPVNNLSF